MLQPNFIAAYIVDNSDQHEPLYLLLRRCKESYLPGIWQIVTGKLGPNEPASQAVIREIFEETGLRINKIYNVDITMFYEQPKNRIAFSANFCAIVDATMPVSICPKEHDAYKWCNLEEALTLLAFPSQKETLRLITKEYVLQKPDPVNLLKIENLN